MFSTNGLLGVLSVVCVLALPTHSRNLVPAKRSATLEARDPHLWRRNILPKNEVQLNYAAGTYHPPSAHVSFTAHDERPILLLEDLDYLLDGVRCVKNHPTINGHGGGMELAFAHQGAFSEALNSWTELDSFVIVTAHQTCNAEDERAAWIVDSVEEDPDSLTVSLHARPVDWHAVGQSCRIRYDHTGYSEWDLRQHVPAPVQRRQLVENETIITFGISPDLSRVQLFPPNATLAPNSSDLNGLDIQLSCVDCGFKSNFSIGVDFEVTLANATCVPTPTDNCVGLTKADMNFTVLDIELGANIEVFLKDEFSRNGRYPVVRVPLEPSLQLLSFVNIGPSIGLMLDWTLDASAGLNFTVGSTAQIAKGATTVLSFLANDGSGKWDPQLNFDGWDNINLSQDPFRVNSGQLNVSAEVALAPFVELAFTVGGIGASASVESTIPGAVVNAALVTGVDRQCNPIGSETFESFSLAFEVGAGLGLSADVHWGVNTGAFPPLLGIPENYDHTLFSKEIPLLPASGSNKTECFVLVGDDNSTSSTTVEGVPASTGTLFSAASAVPTWDFNKIESYFSASSQLPPGVNYTQMARATAVPSVLQNAVSQTISMSSTGGPGPTASPGSTISGALGRNSKPFYVVASVVLVAVCALV